MTFKEQLQQEIIPWTEMMVEKEQQHLDKLNRFVERFDFRDGHFGFLVDAVATSKRYLAHYKQRLQEYIDYAEKL